MTSTALWVAIAAMVPLMGITAYLDARTLKIPNWIPIAALTIFVVTGSWGLPWQVFLWALGAGFAMLVLFFVLYTLLGAIGAGGALGAGDLKLTAALIPFIAWKDAVLMWLIYLVSMIVLAVFYGILWRRQKGRGRSDWESLNQSGLKFRKRTPPLGVSIAGSMIVYPTLLGMRDLGLL